MNNELKNTVGEIFNEIADGLKNGNYTEKVKIGITLSGSEHGIDNILEACKLANAKDSSVEIVIIGSKSIDGFTLVKVDGGQEEEHKKMEELLDSGKIDACVSNHYNFPIGVTTIGRIITPAKNKEMIIASTTGTSASNRIEAMIRNAVAGIITAKSIGIKEPTLGILNVEGAISVEKILKELKANGYGIDFAESKRLDGGNIMRGNDLLLGTPDIMLMDSLSGNLMIKIFSSYTTGGNYEASGYGYGIGIGKDYNRNIFIISRASGAPLIANAIIYAARAVRGNINKIAQYEYEKADKAGLENLIAEHTNKESKSDKDELKAPTKEVVTSQISGIDIMDLDNAVSTLWKEGIYAASGMGCTGPIILVSEKNNELASKILIKNGYLASQKLGC